MDILLTIEGRFAGGQNIHSQASKFPKMATSRWGTRPYRISGGNFQVPKVGKNGHFANGKPVVSPEARIRFLRLQNVQKWSLRERIPGRFVFRKEKLFRCRNIRKNGHFVNGKPAVSPEARIHFLRLRNFQKRSLRERKPG